MGMEPSLGIEPVVKFLRQRFGPQIAAHTVLEASAGEFGPVPVELDQRLTDALVRQGLGQLYSHQLEAFDSIRQGRDTVLVSRTASGKTLSFLLPILHEYLQAESPFGVMLLYPTKALSRDQEGVLGSLLQASGAGPRLGTFDGDTPRERADPDPVPSGLHHHQSRHAARGDPAEPQSALANLPGKAAVPRGGRSAHLPRSFRLPRGQRATAFGSCLRNARQSTRCSSARRRPSAIQPNMSRPCSSAHCRSSTATARRDRGAISF